MPALPIARDAASAQGFSANPPPVSKMVPLLLAFMAGITCCAATSVPTALTRKSATNELVVMELGFQVLEQQHRKSVPLGHPIEPGFRQTPEPGIPHRLHLLPRFEPHSPPV